MKENQFPVHPDDRVLLRFVPLDFIRQFEANAQKNHSQTIDRLAERGGLSIREIWGVMKGESRYWLWPTTNTALADVLEEIRKFQEIQ